MISLSQLELEAKNGIGEVLYIQISAVRILFKLFWMVASDLAGVCLKTVSFVTSRSLGRGCGAVGGVVDFGTRGPQVEPRHPQTLNCQRYFIKEKAKKNELLSGVE